MLDQVDFPRGPSFWCIIHGCRNDIHALSQFVYNETQEPRSWKHAHVYATALYMQIRQRARL